MKDIEIIDIDYSGVNPLYKREEKFKVADIPAPWIVPGEGPFYEAGVKVINGGTTLEKDTDYVFATPVTKLTAMLGKPVYLHIELKPHILTSATELDIVYQKVGEPMLSRNKLLELLENALISGGDIDYETQITGKPLTFAPSAHQMDIREKEEMVGFGNMVTLFTLLKNRIQNQGTKILGLLKAMEAESWDKLDYIYNLRWNAIMHHGRIAVNPHDIKPEQVNIEQIKNFQTASPQQDSEGLRDDLYSTPAGLTKLLEDSEPDSEEYVSQNELPFSYFGSGIYLPPSITGSFEGMGGDYENSCFVREGNGWLVGLMRQFDGKVKGLYYIYQQIMLDRYNYTPVITTYVKYDHPDFVTKGINPDYVISGSGPDVIAIGQLDAQSTLMVSLSNSTLDPKSHSFVEVDMAPLAGAGTPTRDGVYRSMTVSKVGDYIYLWVSYKDAADITVSHPAAGETENFTIRIFRFPVSALSVAGKPKITPTIISLSYDTVDRTRVANQNKIRIYDYALDAQNKVTSYLVGLTIPATSAYSHRRRCHVIVENPHVKGQAKLKIMAVAYWTYNNNGSVGDRWTNISVNYDIDFNNMTMTIDPNWKKPILNTITGKPTNLTPAQNDLFLDRDGEGVSRFFTLYYDASTTSWVPGFGPVSLFSNNVNVGPYGTAYLPLNQTGKVGDDYASVFNPTFIENDRNVNSAFEYYINSPSPFGVAGFPRFFSDVYEYNDQVNAIPIEQFIGTTEDQNVGSFNRVTEGGAGNAYIVRPELQSALIPKRIFGRAPNSNYGPGKNFRYNHPLRNWPQKRDKLSTSHSLAGYHLKPKSNEWAVTKLPAITDTSQDMDAIDSVKGRMYLPLTLKWSYNSNIKTLSAAYKTDDIIVLTKEQYLDIPKQYIGPRFTDINDLLVSVDLCPVPGPESATVYASMMILNYHYSQDPEITRGFIIRFTWTYDGVDPITGYKKIKITVVGTKTWHWIINKFGDSPVVDPTPGGDTAVTGMMALVDGFWDIGVEPGRRTLLRNRSEVYSFGSGVNDLVCYSYSGFSIKTIGNMVTVNTKFDKRNFQGCPEMWLIPGAVYTSYPQCRIAVDGLGLLAGITPIASGSAMNLTYPDAPTLNTGANGFNANDYAFLGATFVQDNWTVFINSDVVATFNGYSMPVTKKIFDLREYSSVYKNSVFYLYCIAIGSKGVYELTKTLKQPDGNILLVSKIITDGNGIATIELYQPFAISGYPLTRIRDAGIPVSSGKLDEVGTYKFIKQSELYGGAIPTRDRSILDITMNNTWPRLDGTTDPAIPLPP